MEKRPQWLRVDRLIQNRSSIAKAGVIHPAGCGTLEGRCFAAAHVYGAPPQKPGSCSFRVDRMLYSDLSRFM